MTNIITVESKKYVVDKCHFSVDFCFWCIQVKLVVRSNGISARKNHASPKIQMRTAIKA